MSEEILRKEILAKNISKDPVDDKCRLKIAKASLRPSYSDSRDIENNKTRKGQRIEDPLPPRLLTIKQASAYIGHSVYMLRELIYSREIPCIQRGNRSKIWVDRVDLDSWIDRQKGMA